MNWVVSVLSVLSVLAGQKAHFLQLRSRPIFARLFMIVYFLILLPLIAAAFFYFGVVILSRSLFRPLVPTSFVGLRFQGVIPAQLPAISEQLAGEAGKLFAQSGLAEKAGDPAVVKNLMPGIEAHIDGFLQERLKERIPVLAMFLSDQILLTIRQSLVAEIEVLLPDVIGKFAGRLEQDLDVEGLVRKRLTAISPADMEQRLRQALKGPLGKLKRGAILWGLLTGLVQAGVLALVLSS